MLEEKGWKIEYPWDVESDDSTSELPSGESPLELPCGEYPLASHYKRWRIIKDRKVFPILRGEAERQRVKDMENLENNPDWPTYEPPSTKSSADYLEELREIQRETNCECKVFGEMEMRMNHFFEKHPISKMSPEVAAQCFFTDTPNSDCALANLGLDNSLKHTTGRFQWGYETNKSPSQILSPIGSMGCLEKKEPHSYFDDDNVNRVNKGRLEDILEN